MSEEPKIPSWIRHAARVDRPEIDAWYRSEDGDLEGHLIWRGQHGNAMSGDAYNVYAVRTSDGRVIGVSERAGLRGLRTVKIGSRVFIRPMGTKTLDGGRKMQRFEIFAEQLELLTDPSGTGGGRGGGGSDGGAAPPEMMVADPSGTGPGPRRGGSDGATGPSEKVPF